MNLALVKGMEIFGDAIKVTTDGHVDVTSDEDTYDWGQEPVSGKIRVRCHNDFTTFKFRDGVMIKWYDSEEMPF